MVIWQLQSGGRGKRARRLDAVQRIANVAEDVAASLRLGFDDRRPKDPGQEAPVSPLHSC